MDVSKQKSSTYAPKMREIVMKLEGMRRDAKDPEDITLADYLKEDGGTTMEALFEDMGVDPSIDTIQNIISIPDSSFRWLIPEIYRDAIRLGLKRAPIYPNLIASEEKVGGLSVIMPFINPADFAPKKVGVAETIPLGDVSFGQKQVKIYKIGRGVAYPYELTQYVSINILQIFLTDFGAKLGMGLDSLALDTAINGDQADGSDSAAVIGVATGGTLVFNDLLAPFVRMNRLGKNLDTMVSGEAMAINMLNLMISSRLPLGTDRFNLTVKTPIPQSASLYIHGKVPTNQVLMVDPGTALIKLNAQPLLLEPDKIVSNQVNALYATLTTGFATMFRDSRMILDQSLAFSSNGFPTYMDPSNQELVDFNAR